jgi:hypothetical protein
MLFVLPSSILSQGTGGAITGSVRNQAGEVVAGAKVTATNSGTSQARSVSTDQEGVYRLLALAVGTYEIVVESEGFAKVIRQVTIRVNEDARVDFELYVAGAVEQVNVVASDGPITETSNSILGIVIENKQIVELPLNGRNFLQLGTLVANVSSTASLSGGSEGGILNGPFAVSGQRDRSLTFLVDGVDNNNSLSNSLSAQVSLDSIQEFKMITSLGSAEFGTHSGGTINILTKSGTNEFHFNAFEFFRHDSLNSPNYFEKVVDRNPAPFNLNQFGGTASGPVLKDRTFFLGSYEGQRLHVSNVQFATVPAESERAGRFRNPFTGQAIDLPVDPVSAEILRRYIPLPNFASDYGNYLSTPRIDSDNDFALARLDHLLFGDGVLNVRYFISNNTTFNPIIFSVFSTAPGLSSTAPTIPGFGLDESSRTQNLAVGYTHNFTSNLINDLRLGYNRLRSEQITENEISPSEIGFDGVDSPTGLFDMEIPGITRLGSVFVYPLNQRMNNFHLADSVSYLRGRHSLKFGGETRWLRHDAQALRKGAGYLIFSGLASQISPVADFVLGIPTAAVLFQRDLRSPLRQLQTGLYFQDDYQVTRRLVLNYGLRYEVSTVPSNSEGAFATFSFERGLYRPEIDTEEGIFRGDHNNFAPRLGFAWSATADGHTVVRGGYGLFYDALLLTHALGLNSNSLEDPLFLVSFAQRRPGNLGEVFSPPSLMESPAQRLLIYDQGMRTPYAQHFNLNIQRELSSNMMISFGYVGTRTTRLIRSRDINQAVYIPGNDASGNPLSTQFNIASRRPTQLYDLADFDVDSITQIESSGSSTYHSFQATFSHRLRRGISLLSSYTWSKSIDDGTDPVGFTGDGGGPQDSNDTRSERGLSVFDLRHRFTLACTYDLPLSGSKWVEGWQLNTLVTLQSGQPFTPLLGFDTSLTGSANLRPNYAPGAFIKKDGQLYLNPGLPKDPVTGIPLALIPEAGEFGTLGRNTFIGPGYKNLDLSVIKDTRLSEKFRLQARFEIFNLFNTTNLSLPARRLLDPFFGRSTKTQDVAGGVPGIGGGGPRVAQIALKLIY